MLQCDWLRYLILVYTKTVDSVKREVIGSSNSEYPVLFISEQLGINGGAVCISDKWRNHPN